MTLARRGSRCLVLHRLSGVGLRAALVTGCVLAMTGTAGGTEAHDPALARAQSLVQAGNLRAAIDGLKPLVAAHPDDEVLALALAHAYRLDKPYVLLLDRLPVGLDRWLSKKEQTRHA